MEEQLISFETAKLAKEAGFDCTCESFYRDNGQLAGKRGKSAGLMPPYNQGINRNIAPTQSLLQKWLRDEHKIEMVLEPYPYNYSILVFRWDKEQISVEGDTYEQALEGGLKVALELLKKSQTSKA